MWKTIHRISLALTILAGAALLILDNRTALCYTILSLFVLMPLWAFTGYMWDRAYRADK